MIKKTDWKNVEMPALNDSFILEKELSVNDMKLIKEGHKPQEMEDKWFMYVEEDRLYIHRSWTGYCIYIVDLSTQGKLNTIVNRDTNQYTETSIEQDKLKLNVLINRLIKENGRNVELMKKYIERKMKEKK